MSAVDNGPQITKRGLILCLDAGNNNSYSPNIFQAYGSGLVTEDVTFSINGTGTFKRVAAGTVIGGYKVKSKDVVYSYVLGTNGCHYHGNGILVPAGIYATFTFDYLVTGATTYPIVDYLANFESVGVGSIGTANSLQNIWQRRSFTSLITSTPGTLNMYLYPGACSSSRLADSGTIYYRNPRVELLSYDSGTTNFSSSNDVLRWYDVSPTGRSFIGATNLTPYFFPSSNGFFRFAASRYFVAPENSNFNTETFTIECWARTSNLNQNGFLFEKGNVNTQYALFFEQTNGLKLRTKSSSGDLSDLTINTSTYLTANTWFLVTASYNNGVKRIYINGRYISTNTVSAPLSVNTGGMSIGVHGGESGSRGYYYDGDIASLKVYNSVLTDNEIFTNFQAIKTRFGL